MLETLSLVNMSIFKSLYYESKSKRSYDKDFFSVYNNENMFMKYIHRKFVRLIKLEEEFIGFIWYEASSDQYIKILSLYINPSYYNKVNIYILRDLDKHILCYEEFKDKEYALELLGFYPIMITYLMILNLNDIPNFRINNRLAFENLEVELFKSGKDEPLRCKLQNEIFFEEDRKPIIIEDIYSDMIQDYYLRDKCFFLTRDKESIGYGQIILNRGNYTLVNFGVVPNERNKGFGSLFLEYIIEVCKLSNIINLYIRVSKDNEKAINLYEKFGFKIIDEVVLWQRY